MFKNGNELSNTFYINLFSLSQCPIRSHLFRRCFQRDFLIFFNLFLQSILYFDSIYPPFTRLIYSKRYSQAECWKTIWYFLRQGWPKMKSRRKTSNTKRNQDTLNSRIHISNTKSFPTCKECLTDSSWLVWQRKEQVLLILQRISWYISCHSSLEGN